MCVCVYIYIYIYIFNSWNIDCDPWVSWSFFAKQQSPGIYENGMNRKLEIEKIRKITDKKTVENSYGSLRVVASV